MRRLLRIILTATAAVTAVAALVVAAIPIWLVLRVPPAIVPPAATTEPGPH
jgi:hypothetical protein